MRFIHICTASALAVAVAGCASQSPGEDERIVVTGSKASRSDNNSQTALPALPPPPSPALQTAPTYAAEAVADGVVSGSRVKAVPPSYRYIPPVIVPGPTDRERYDGEEVSPVKIAAAEPVSTFSVDVDTGAYANSRRFLSQGQMPPKAAVRTEEFINYFRYDYERPLDRSQPFSVSFDAARTPWNADTRLIRIGLAGYDIERDERPPANLVFLMDVSGSMNSPDKLPLVKTALAGLAGELQPRDTVSIVVYAGAAGLVLEPTSDTRAIRAALDRLRAGGSTAGGAGLELAYRIAEDNFIDGGVNRVILATDGDFNVGVQSRDALIEMIEKKRDSGITLTTLGFGTGNYNEAMMEQIANHGNGNYAYIDSALEAKKVLGDEMSSTLFTIAKDVKIQVEFNPAVISQYRLIGYENRALRDEDFDNDAVDAGDIGAGHQVTAIYEVVPVGAKGWIADRRYGDKLPAAATSMIEEAAYVKLRYKLPDGDKSTLIDYVMPTSSLRNASAPRGDFAFATAVAGFGQKLRADPLLEGFSYRDLVKLAGRQHNYWRQEFIKLASLAGGLLDEDGPRTMQGGK
ncbi:MAG: VWA domain-containing protein [Sphingomonadaceae bacterium]|nr:MAG: VWA domain-containing protein [Sphingomonadaceae bacterium]